MAKKAAPKTINPPPKKKAPSKSESKPKATEENKPSAKKPASKSPAKGVESVTKASTKAKAETSKTEAKTPAPAPKKGKSKEPVAIVGAAPGLGKKFTCYSCSTKFYDLNKPEKLCPKCGADQLAKPALKSRAAALRSQEFDVEDEAPLDEDFVEEDEEIADPVEEGEEEEEEE